MSDLDVDESETDTVRAQVARLGSVCRLFAPAYRQITLAGLGGGATPEDREIAYGDVLDAWRSYVVEANDGRGVVLIGHSQGAGHLRRLLAEEIDPEPALRARLVSSVLLGTTVAVPEGDTVGAAFSEIPACAGPDDTGCVISWASYPASAPPADGGFFGQAQDEGERALCVDPAELAGTDAPLGSVLPTRVSLLGGLPGFDDVDTPYVSLPGSIRTSCEVAGAAVCPSSSSGGLPRAATGRTRRLRRDAPVRLGHPCPMSRRLVRPAAAAILLAGALLPGCGDDGDDDGDGPPVVEGDIELGAELFVSASPPCAACHTLSDAGSAARVGPNLDEVYAPAFFVAQTMRDGIGAMPSYEGTLTDEEIAAVAVYVEANSAAGRQATDEGADE